jgi:hypothetical protein
MGFPVRRLVVSSGRFAELLYHECVAQVFFDPEGKPASGRFLRLISALTGAARTRPFYISC